MFGVPTGVNTVIGTGLGAAPPELGGNPAVGDLIAVVLGASATVTDTTLGGVAAARPVIEPLAGANEASNTIIGTGAATIDWTGDALRPTVPGLMPTAGEMSAIARSFQEPAP